MRVGCVRNHCDVMAGEVRMNVDGEVLLFLGISIPSIRSCFCTIRTCRIANTSRSQFLGMLVMSFDSTFVIAESEPLHSSLAGTV